MTVSAVDRLTPPRLSQRAKPQLVLDCRWLERGGVGMATELTLRAFAQLHDAGELDMPMTLRGDRAKLTSFAWPTATIEDDRSDPHQWLGQRGWQHDDGRVEMAFHQLRPLSKRPRVQWLHDLIPVHFARSALDRRLRLEYLRRIVATSDQLIVVSQHTFRCAVNELAADPSRMTVVSYPPDLELLAEVETRRSELPQADRLLFVGRFARHKNLDRLIAAFSRTDFRRNGGTLHLVGGTTSQLRELQARHDLLALRVEIEGTVPRSRIVDLFATSVALIQPSLEEGFGLPVWEAQTIGLPVITADAGSLPELVPDPDFRFDPMDTVAIGEAIDRVVTPDQSRRPFTRPDGPSLMEFGAQVERTLSSTFPSKTSPNRSITRNIGSNDKDFQFTRLSKNELP